MIKHYKIILVNIVVVLLAVFATSCWDAKDINDKLIVTSIMLDFKDDEIRYYLEIANIEAGKSTDSGSITNGKYILVKGHAKTIPEFRDNLNTQLDKPLYLSGVRALVFTEDFADEYLVEYLYRFRTDETYRKKGTTIITREDPEEMYESVHGKNSSAGFLIEGTLKTLSDSGQSFTRTTARLIENLSADYTGILIPCIGLQDKEISLIGYSVVNGSEVTGFIPMEDSRGVVFLKADNPKFFYIVPYKDFKFTIKVNLTKQKIKPSYENGKINFDVKCDFKAELLYGDKKTPYNFEDEANIEITEILTGALKNELSDTIERAQKEFNCDYFQFDDEFRVHFPVEFQGMDWQKEFSNISTKIDVKVDMSVSHMMNYGPNEVK